MSAWQAQHPTAQRALSKLCIIKDRDLHAMHNTRFVLQRSIYYPLVQRLAIATACARYGSNHSAAYVASHVADVHRVPVPLCRRPPGHTEQMVNLITWRQAVLQEIKAIQDTFAASDGGPAASDLQREVMWVLDDAVAAWREQEQQQWQPCTWQQLSLELQTAIRCSRSIFQWQVQLRASVKQLEQLWHLRLKNRVPFQYLIHTAHWRDLVLSVGPGILVPRPETELIVDLAAQAIAANSALAAAPWTDLGTGSGAIAIGTALMLQQHISHPQVWAVDISPTAVAYATANAAACGVQQAVHVAQGSWFEPLQHLPRQLSGVLSNPPYIPHDDMSGLQVEVGGHEPWSALDGGPGNGLGSLQVICEGARDMLAPGGFLALETAGNEQAYLVQQLLHQFVTLSHVPAFTDVKVHDDCYGIPRFVSATRSQQ
eukprot:GHRR01014162.1.p1 GENE.GHRR01014162.1~~GHRR01014162.1.p1  ORF type:complete len:429 (+),score=125.10 GHRR01014162.1:102-1388(+)